MSTVIELKLELPDRLAEQAARMGPLEPDALRDIPREAVRNRLFQRLLEARELIAASGLKPLTMEEVQAEIEADRARRRRSKR